MMAGTGECWPYIRRRGGAAITSIDFSRAMVARQKRRRSSKGLRIDVRCENALATSLPSASVDFVVSAFGLKTLDPHALRRFGGEIRRILRPGGHFSLIEISVPADWALARLYRWYVNGVIPMIGRLCPGDTECYRMLGVYTEAFGSCSKIAPVFQELGLAVTVKRHFYGCATSLVGRKESGTNHPES
jgi:demethylmenaquinone methyltransferase/2-methoxy-6-polyprenyl-1,4-benzoquinol methylase